MAGSSRTVSSWRSWLLGLSLLALALVLAVGAVLWQAVELTSLAAVSERIEGIKPVAGAVRLLLIGLLALVWARLVDFFAQIRNSNNRTRTHWLALRWRVTGWLLVIELVLGRGPARSLPGRSLGSGRMSVDSYLELFTTLFGWAFYGVLWDVLVGTGIVYLPFLGILIDNWREPAEGGEFGTVTGLSLRRMEIELFIALLVVVLAGQPAALTPLNAGTLSYSPIPTLGTRPRRRRRWRRPRAPMARPGSPARRRR